MNILDLFNMLQGFDYESFEIVNDTEFPGCKKIKGPDINYLYEGPLTEKILVEALTDFKAHRLIESRRNFTQTETTFFPWVGKTSESLYVDLMEMYRLDKSELGFGEPQLVMPGGAYGGMPTNKVPLDFIYLRATSTGGQTFKIPHGKQIYTVRRVEVHSVEE